MADSPYAIKNLKDIEDGAAGRGGDMEARFARKDLDSEQLGVSFFRYGAGYRSPVGHYHREQEEAYVVVAGSGRIKLDDEVIELKPWDVVRVAPAVVRAFEGGADGLEVIAIGGSKPPEGDGEMVKDWWVD
jgi:mannose-6-phosphate isomerase-like protein (cupin superfamily)